MITGTAVPSGLQKAVIIAYDIVYDREYDKYSYCIQKGMWILPGYTLY